MHTCVHMKKLNIHQAYSHHASSQHDYTCSRATNKLVAALHVLDENLGVLDAVDAPDAAHRHEVVPCISQLVTGLSAPVIPKYQKDQV